MKKIMYLFVALFIFLISDSVRAANHISSITMDIYIDSNGTAHVKEVWDAYLDSGTEGYKPYYNLQNSSIQNFKVYDDETLYKNIGTWNTNASFSEKSYKNGINYLTDGVELCFGISSYGTHKYRMEYEITNFVTGLTDSDMVYWTLMPHNFSESPDSVYIKIYADTKFSDNLEVWGYGNYGGYAYVYDGYIEMSTNNSLSSNEYMTILVKFPKGTFNTINNTENNNFEYYYNLAQEGADGYNSLLSDPNSILVIICKILYYVLYGILGLIMALPFILACTAVCDSSVGGYNWHFKKGEKRIPKNVPLYRDIPFNKDIYKIYLLANLYGIAKKKTDLLGAVLLKWLKEGKIEIIKIETSILNRNETAIRFKENFTTDLEFELALYQMMYAASKDGILESKEFEKWCRTNYSGILHWFDRVIGYERNSLLTNGQLEIVEKSIFKIKRYYVKTEVFEDAKIVKGLKKFLIEFTKIDDREAIEVVNWEEYLIIAQILGIADKVAKQFKKLYPEIIMNPSNSYSYDDLDFIHDISIRSIRVATSARVEADARSSSYSSGGGGRSSGGGGGGSRGGGSSGGGGFR